MLSIVHQFTIRISVFIFAFLFITDAFGQQETQKRKRIKSEAIDKQPERKTGQDSYFESSFMRYSDYNYKESVTSVLFHRLGWELTSPVIVYGTDEKLFLSFDDLDGDYQVWQYTVIHCDADWKPTDLWPNEYIEGFTDDYIRDYQFSFNTLQPFTNYSLVIPNEQFKFTLSGNYILKVYPEGQPDTPILTRRFMVVEPKVTVKALVKAASTINERFTHQ